jgi:hypothetical protein
MERQELYAQINAGMTQERFHSFERSLQQNRVLISRHGGLHPLVGELKDRHVVICGAGPSIEDAYRDLKKICERDSIALIAADMAYRPLLRAGIRPRYAISCETTPRDFFAGLDTSKTTLLAFSCVCPRTVREWKGPVRFYNWLLRGEPWDRLWSEAGTSLGFAATGSIVTSQALSIALGCGAASVMLAGNDLGFFDHCYARGTVRETSVNPLCSRLSPLESIEFSAAWRARHYVIPRGEKKFFTNHQFLAAKYWMEDTAAKSPIPVYDASVPGCSPGKVEKFGMKHYAEMVLSSRKGVWK